LTFDGNNLSTTGVYKITGAAIATGAERWIGTDGGSTNWFYNATAAGAHVFSMNNTEYMRLTSTGLGIGTSAPSKLLTIGSTTAVNPTVRMNGSITGGSDTYTYCFGIDDTTDFAGIKLKYSDRTTKGLQVFTAPGFGYPITFSASSATTQMTLDTSGNLGLGVTPSAWWSVYRGFDITLGCAIAGQTNDATVVHIAGNAFVDSTPAWKYKETGVAQRYQQNAGTHQWYTSPSGTAGDPITFTQVMTLDASGRLGIGITSPAARLHIQGTSTSGAATNISSFNGLRIDGNLSSSGVTGITYQDGGGGGAGIGLARGGAFETQILFYTNPAGTTTAGAMTERMRIDPDGNVGIGANITASASSAPSFTVGTGSGSPAITLYSATSGSSQISFADATSGAGAYDGYILYDQSSRAMVFGTASAERARITDDAYLRMASGSGGIQFNGDTAAANALDDYEEGVWTFGISFDDAAVGITTSVSSGTYTKIGRQVTVNGFLVLTSKGSSTGQAKITGLPFAVANTDGNYSPPALRFSNVGFANQYQGLTVVNTTTVGLEEITEAGAVTAITDADFANNSQVAINLTYFV
jgi:hypothetical protein